MRISIEAVRSEPDLDAIRELFREYVAWLGIDLSFQNFASEFAALPGKYAPPRGEIFIAKSEDGSPVGCIGVAPLDRQGACEMKRLYVRDSARGSGVGRALVMAAVAFAELSGYREMLLDTLPSMPAAIAIYRTLGFEPVPPYYVNPVPDALFFMKTLGSEQSPSEESVDDGVSLRKTLA